MSKLSPVSGVKRKLDFRAVSFTVSPSHLLFHYLVADSAGF